MTIEDTWCTVDAYFSVKPEKKEAFDDVVNRFVRETKNENGIRYYGWSSSGEEVHCRQGYLNAEGFLEHAANVRHLFEEAMTISDCSRLAIHGPEEELEKLREPMAEIPLQYFSLTSSFRR
jgi:quinol monooxygenase YgiN